MSRTAIHESKQSGQLCQRCHNRKARFQYRGAVRADRDHTLCFECYRSERERRRAQMLVEVERPRPLRSPFIGASVLSDREIAHRTAMIAHLQTQHRPGTA